MDYQRLSAIATSAIEHTLRYHLGPETRLEENDKALVRDSIQEIFPLRTHARDIHVAHLEIACDAAVTFAETVNKTKPEPQHINLRWFYICVQSLLSIELKPELLQDGQVDRLTLLTAQVNDASVSDSEVSLSSSCLSAAGEDSSWQDTSTEPSITTDTEAPVALKDARTKWDDDELQRMIQLKRSGLTHKLIAERIGRTQSAVENKYGRIMKMDQGRDEGCLHRAMSSPNLKRQHSQEDDAAQPGNSGKRIHAKI